LDIISVNAIKVKPRMGQARIKPKSAAVLNRLIGTDENGHGIGPRPSAEKKLI
jgi:hypothetical protein